MFGTLRPIGCRHARAELAVHERFTCGLCSSLGGRYGALSRALVSSDAVFVGLLADAFASSGAGAARTRCPMLPIVRRESAAPDSVSLRFASAIQMLLADQWLADRAVEGRWLARLVRPLARRRVRAAQAELVSLGVDVGPLAGFEDAQAAVEARSSSDPCAAAEPTAAALGHVFEQIASLPGSSAEVQTEQARTELRSLGRAVGGAIYWADALDDLERDYLAGDFNPCIVRRPRGWAAGAHRRRRPRSSHAPRRGAPRSPHARGARTGGLAVISASRVRRSGELLDTALRQVAASLRALPLARHRGILENILCRRFPTLARRLVARALATASPTSRRRLFAWIQMPWYLRLAARAVLTATMVVAWLGAIKASWAKPGATAPEQAPSAGERADGGPDASPGSPVDAGEGPETAPEPTGAPSVRPFGPSPFEPGKEGSGSGDESSAGAGDPDGGGGWSNPFDCCNPEKCCNCKGCMEGCCNRCCKEPCGDVCGRCCDPCKGCGNCGNGCCCK